jgi:hypothetical protein
VETLRTFLPADDFNMFRRFFVSEVLVDLEKIMQSGGSHDQNIPSSARLLNLRAMDDILLSPKQRDGGSDEQ